MPPQLPEKSRVLVTGGTGFTGQRLVDRLLAQGHAIRVIARPSPRATELGKRGCEVVEGQVYDPDAVQRACRDIDYIFHVAAAYREAGISDDIYAKVHVESTKLLARAAAELKGFKRFVHVSTMGVHGHIENPPANEESPYGPGDLYQSTKLEGELWIRDFAPKHNLSMSVIRPAAIYGPGDRRLLKVFKMVKWPVFPILGYGKCLYHLVHVEDLVSGMMLAAIHPRAEQEVFLCGDRESIPLEDMARTIGEAIGHRPRFMRIPVTPFFILGDVCEAVCKPFKIEPPIYRRRVAFFTKDRSFDMSKIRNYLGFENAYTNRSGLMETASWYKSNGWL
jgi:dihydroflavonol-4-reductase